ncbi:MAG: hypothetical protein GDA36_06000 [Rhodobacteraceae bacterium]|nr:hypothetical protein [Paracoccaceae bacterium]
MAIPSGPLALPGLNSGQSGFGGPGLRDCRYLRVAGDSVCGATQVLFDCRQRQSGVLFWPARTIGRCVIVA